MGDKRLGHDQNDGSNRRMVMKLVKCMDDNRFIAQSPELLWQIIPKIIYRKIIRLKGAVLARSEFAGAGRTHTCSSGDNNRRARITAGLIRA